MIISISELTNMNEEELNKLCFHLTSIYQMESIDEKGLIAQIGNNSSGSLGKEKTSKVFFSKGYIGVLAMANRAMDIISRKLNDYDKDTINILGINQNVDLESNIERLLESKMYYLLNIKGTSKSEYENMSDENKKNIYYLTDDLDEETNRVMDDANMHTISGFGVPKELLIKIVDDNYRLLNSFEVIIELCKKFKEFHPNEELPMRNQSINYLELFYKKYVLEESKISL